MSDIDISLDSMPDIAALEAANGLSFEQAAAGLPPSPPEARDVPKDEAPPARERDEAGKFKAKEPEKAEKADPAEADDDDPWVEFPASEEGKEATRAKLSEVWTGYQKASQLEKDLADAKNNARVLTPPEIEAELHRVAAERQKAIEWATQLRSSLAVGEPNRDMLNPSSPLYDPTGYYEQLQRADQVRAYAKQLDDNIQQQKTAADQEQRAALSARMAREQAALQKIWPELATESVAKNVKSELSQHYGLDEATINSVVDHRFFALAKDALAYRSAKAIEAKAVEKVSAKPKLVPSVARSTKTGAQRNASEARARLASSGSIEDAVAALDGLF